MEKVFYNGKIVTMTEEEPEAVLIHNGTIKKVGDFNAVMKYASEEVEKIDLDGRCLMPSFIDAHSHIVMNGQTAGFADLSDCVSFDDIISVLKEYIKNHKVSAEGAVIGYGYDHNFLKEQRHPDKMVLDRVSADIPIMIIHISAHLACVNSTTLRLAGIDQNTQNPDGGFIGRIRGSSEPNGYIEEAGLAMVNHVIKNRMNFDMNAAAEKMQEIYIENGITTVQDGASTDENIRLLKMMADSQRLKIDVVAYPLITEKRDGISDENKDYKNRFKIGGYKIILDGSPQGRSAWLSEPYLGDGDKYCGYPYWDDTAVKKMINRALAERKQLLAHCNGDAASEQFLSMYEECLGDGKVKEDLRPVMIHCQTVRNDQLERMSKINMIASIFVGHVWYWGDIHLKNFGEVRGNHISPVKDAVDRGVVVNFHQDTPVTKPNMLHSIWCAVNRISRSGNIIGGDQKVSVYEALKAVTIHAAYQYFEEDVKGSIEEGKKADFVILNQSPLEVEPIRIKDIKVMETIKDGETIYKNAG